MRQSSYINSLLIKDISYINKIKYHFPVRLVHIDFFLKI